MDEPKPPCTTPKVYPSLADWRSAIYDECQRYSRMRVTKYAKSRNIANDDVVYHNEVPIWFLVKEFKKLNHIKMRKFTSLHPEHQQEWVKYYISNRLIRPMTTEEHRQYHSEYVFNERIKCFQKIITVIDSQMSEVTASESIPVNIPLSVQSEPLEQHIKKHRKRRSKHSKCEPLTENEPSIPIVV